MTDILKATRFIVVASPSDLTDQEWKDKVPGIELWPPVHKDYALLKVLSMLRMKDAKSRYPVQVFKHEKPITPLDFSGLQDSDVIFFVGHGNDHGFYAMGPDATEGGDRLMKLITKDGQLKSKRKDKEIVILLLSCRAGLGFHKGVARRLTTELGRDVTVGGAIGFTFGSPRTSYLAHNEVLIRGIPWFIEYPTVYKNDPTQAEKETSAREGKTISYEAKKADIDAFKEAKKKIEKGLKEDVVDKLKSTEVNKALDEIEKDFRSKWLGLLQSQFELYSLAKKKSNLEFDMWYDKMTTDAYVWTTGKTTTTADADSVLTGFLTPNDTGLGSVR